MHKTNIVKVGDVLVGGGNQIVIQAMTNTNTADVESTVAQVIELYEAGAEIVRMTVPDKASAKAVPLIKEMLHKKNYSIPLVGCFHFNGSTLLEEFPECAKALDKLRMNPGNIGFGDKRDAQFESFIQTAIKYDKPIRIGVNFGSLDQTILTELMDKNSKLSEPRSSDEVTKEALVLSTLTSAKKAEEIGLPQNKIVISCKISNVPNLISVYEELANRCNYALHLGLTEAGNGLKGIISSTIAIGALLQKGIGDTIRVSVTPSPGESRTKEVKICQEILQSLELRAFKPQITSCPGCGRTKTKSFEELVDKTSKFVDEKSSSWRKICPEVGNLKIAVMGCVVNGPGESKHADIGISFPGIMENLVAVVYINGKRTHALKGNNIAEQFQKILDDYVVNSYHKSKVSA